MGFLCVLSRTKLNPVNQLESVLHANVVYVKMPWIFKFRGRVVFYTHAFCSGNLGNCALCIAMQDVIGDIKAA